MRTDAFDVQRTSPTAGDGDEPPHTSGVDALGDGRRLFQAYVFFFEELVDVGAL
ncbi:hypothetical protein [Streptomyces mirabilis]|uniref:hypothetical protein n=1 Tax=Streptomyces mirabilis TaxID=68239 RepID=UPI0036DA73E0